MKYTQTTTIVIPKQEEIKSKGSISVDSFAQMLADEIDILNANDYKKAFIRIRDKAVKAFYASYSPRYYHRKYSLRYMAYPSIEDNEFFIELGIDNPGYFASHHQDEEFIYKNSFQLGFHGGSPHNGIPTWRTPYPEYTHWGRWASRGPSAYLMIKDGWSSFLSGEAKTIQAKNQKIALANHRQELEALIINKINNAMAKGGK